MGLSTLLETASNMGSDGPYRPIRAAMAIEDVYTATSETFKIRRVARIVGVGLFVVQFQLRRGSSRICLYATCFLLCPSQAPKPQIWTWKMLIDALHTRSCMQLNMVRPQFGAGL